jgi:hypothetical protein
MTDTRVVFWPSLSAVPKIIQLYSWNFSELSAPTAETSIGKIDKINILPVEQLATAQRLHGQYETILYEYWSLKTEKGAIES